MPLSKKWSYYSKENINFLPNRYAIYEIGNIDSGEVLYIGEGLLYDRLKAHLPDGTRTHENVVGANGFRFELTGSKVRARQRQNAELAKFERAYLRRPKFNQRSWA